MLQQLWEACSLETKLKEIGEVVQTYRQHKDLEKEATLLPNRDLYGLGAQEHKCSVRGVVPISGGRGLIHRMMAPEGCKRQNVPAEQRLL